MLTRYPQSPKAPDALLAIAAVQAEQGDTGSARNTLEDIIARYPGYRGRRQGAHAARVAEALMAGCGA